jgi:hypothetical protein
MPSDSPATFTGAWAGDAAGALVVRDATDVKGTSNPDIESTITSNADQLLQAWGHRKFVSRPLAAHTFSAADGNWTFSYARSESNLLHNMVIFLQIQSWRPSNGTQVATLLTFDGSVTTEPTVAATEQAESVTVTSGSSSIIAGDILVFMVCSQFQQGMSTSYTDQFAYDGTTEASTTTCASFVAPPAPLTLFGGTPDPSPLSIVSAHTGFGPF